ncbi:hypothetical protein K402DRAFT_426014 [Aulographum hederae CBS 113979]|uniref:Uncharacterized protein n=1 Tax=Aulographum hederae CBS 113979 TaxID=1176131 RepID=A0A6G1GIL8_9PEZI|nr:hypothetical protein K402DRAFT_426014 [Aulographum hederae CBS 113979]
MPGFGYHEPQGSPERLGVLPSPGKEIFEFPGADSGEGSPDERDEEGRGRSELVDLESEHMTKEERRRSRVLESVVRHASPVGYGIAESRKGKEREADAEQEATFEKDPLEVVSTEEGKLLAIQSPGTGKIRSVSPLATSTVLVNEPPPVDDRNQDAPVERSTRKFQRSVSPPEPDETQPLAETSPGGYQFPDQVASDIPGTLPTLEASKEPSISPLASTDATPMRSAVGISPISSVGNTPQSKSPGILDSKTEISTRMIVGAPASVFNESEEEREDASIPPVASTEEVPRGQNWNPLSSTQQDNGTLISPPIPPKIPMAEGTALSAQRDEVPSPNVTSDLPGSFPEDSEELPPQAEELQPPPRARGRLSALQIISEAAQTSESPQAKRLADQRISRDTNSIQGPVLEPTSATSTLPSDLVEASRTEVYMGKHRRTSTPDSWDQTGGGAQAEGGAEMSSDSDPTPTDPRRSSAVPPSATSPRARPPIPQTNPEELQRVEQKATKLSQGSPPSSPPIPQTNINDLMETEQKASRMSRSSIPSISRSAFHRHESAPSEISRDEESTGIPLHNVSSFTHSTGASENERIEEAVQTTLHRPQLGSPMTLDFTRHQQETGLQLERPMSFVPLPRDPEGAPPQEYINRPSPEPQRQLQQQPAQRFVPTPPRHDSLPAQGSPSDHPLQSRFSVGASPPRGLRQQGAGASGQRQRPFGQDTDRRGSGQREHLQSIHEQAFTRQAIDPRQHGSEFGLPGVGPPPEPQSARHRHTAFLRPGQRPNNAEKPGAANTRINPQLTVPEAIRANSYQSNVTADSQDSTEKKKRKSGGLFHSFSKPLPSIPKEEPTPERSQNPGAFSAAKPQKENKAPKKLQRATTAPPPPSEEPNKKKRFSAFGALFSRSSTTGSKHQPNKLTKSDSNAHRNMKTQIDDTDARNQSAYQSTRQHHYGGPPPRSSSGATGGRAPDPFAPRPVTSPLEQPLSSAPPMPRHREDAVIPPPGGFYAPSNFGHTQGSSGVDAIEQQASAGYTSPPPQDYRRTPTAEYPSPSMLGYGSPQGGNGLRYSSTAPAPSGRRGSGNIPPHERVENAYFPVRHSSIASYGPQGQVSSPQTSGQSEYQASLSSSVSPISQGQNQFHREGSAGSINSPPPHQPVPGQYTRTPSAGHDRMSSISEHQERPYMLTLPVGDVAQGQESNRNSLQFASQAHMHAAYGHPQAQAQAQALPPQPQLHPPQPYQLQSYNPVPPQDPSRPIDPNNPYNLPAVYPREGDDAENMTWAAAYDRAQQEELLEQYRIQHVQRKAQEQVKRRLEEQARLQLEARANAEMVRMAERGGRQGEIERGGTLERPRSSIVGIPETEMRSPISAPSAAPLASPTSTGTGPVVSNLRTVSEPTGEESSLYAAPSPIASRSPQTARSPTAWSAEGAGTGTASSGATQPGRGNLTHPPTLDAANAAMCPLPNSPVHGQGYASPGGFGAFDGRAGGAGRGRGGRGRGREEEEPIVMRGASYPGMEWEPRWDGTVD